MTTTQLDGSIKRIPDTFPMGDGGRGILVQTLVNPNLRSRSNLIFPGGGGGSGVGGIWGYSDPNFGQPKSEVYVKSDFFIGVFWSELWSTQIWNFHFRGIGLSGL